MSTNNIVQKAKPVSNNNNKTKTPKHKLQKLQLRSKQSKNTNLTVASLVRTNQELQGNLDGLAERKQLTSSEGSVRSYSSSSSGGSNSSGASSNGSGPSLGSSSSDNAATGPGTEPDDFRSARSVLESRLGAGRSGTGLPIPGGGPVPSQAGGPPRPLKNALRPMRRLVLKPGAEIKFWGRGYVSSYVELMLVLVLFYFVFVQLAPKFFSRDCGDSMDVNRMQAHTFSHGTRHDKTDDELWRLYKGSLCDYTKTWDHWWRNLEIQLPLKYVEFFNVPEEWYRVIDPLPGHSDGIAEGLKYWLDEAYSYELGSAFEWRGMGACQDAHESGTSHPGSSIPLRPFGEGRSYQWVFYSVGLLSLALYVVAYYAVTGRLFFRKKVYHRYRLGNSEIAGHADLRADSISLMDLKHKDAQYMVYTYSTNERWYTPQKPKVFSAEMVAQITTAAKLPLVEEEKVVWDRLARASSTVNTVNIDRYMSLMNKQNPVQASMEIAFALWKELQDEISERPFTKSLL